jgi:hypothetical protein
MKPGEQKRQYAALMLSRGVVPQEPTAWRQCLTPGDIVAVQANSGGSYRSAYRVTRITDNFLCLRAYPSGPERKISRTTGREKSATPFPCIVPATADEIAAVQERFPREGLPAPSEAETPAESAHSAAEGQA